jgi:uncharacterized protein DUF3224
MSQSTKVFLSSASILSWDEDRSESTQSKLPRLTPATVKLNLDDVKGTVTSNYQMIYLPAGPGREKDGCAVYSFTDVVEAEDFDGKKGSFMTQGKGSFDAVKFRVEANFDIVPGSGKGELGELFNGGGKGSFESDTENPHKVQYKFVVA